MSLFDPRDPRRMTDAWYHDQPHSDTRSTGQAYAASVGWKGTNSIKECAGTHIKVCSNSREILRELIMDRVEWKVERR